MVKSLKSIEGFDYVGIGVIPCGEGDGTYILCKNLAEFRYYCSRRSTSDRQFTPPCQANKQKVRK